MTSPLIDAAGLQALLGDPRLVVVDCRHNLLDVEQGERAHAESHLPGAVFLHLDRDLSAPKTGKNGRHPLPDPQTFAALLAAKGIGADSFVVAYDQGNGMTASRVWWMLRWIGHAHAAVLDGGFSVWKNQGLPLSTEAVRRAPAANPIHPVPGSAPTLSAAEVIANIGTAQRLLIDARAADRFAGQNETIDPVAGHIPGAANRPFSENLTPEGRFKPTDVLKQEFAALLDGRDSTQVVHQCGSGVSACHNILTAAIAGYPLQALYPGSWSEWIADPARPVAA